MKQGYCEIVVVLDRSGSMEDMVRDVEGGFGQFLAAQRQIPGECRISLVQFDTGSIEAVYEGCLIAHAPALKLTPRGGTPLLDAVGQTITRFGERLKALPEDQRPDRVLVVIITDGQENSSVEFNRTHVRDMVTSMRRA